MSCSLSDETETSSEVLESFQRCGAGAQLLDIKIVIGPSSKPTLL
jgi:hypothetical protein